MVIVSMRNNIEAERGRLMFTKSKMSEVLGVTMKTYNSYIEDGPIPSPILEKLREITGRSVDYLLGLDEDRPA